jgi:hypothetical protein
MSDANETNDLKLDAGARARAHEALDRWIDDCEKEAVELHENGQSGYIGRASFNSFVDDHGVTLRVERSVSASLD